MSIITKLTKILTGEKTNLDDMETMRRDPNAPVIAPVAVSGVRGSPRMKYRR